MLPPRVQVSAMFKNTIVKQLYLKIKDELDGTENGKRPECCGKKT